MNKDQNFSKEEELIIKNHLNSVRCWGSMVSKSKSKALKNAKIVKTGVGESDDFLSILKINGLDSDTVNNFLNTIQVGNDKKYHLTKEQEKEWEEILSKARSKVSKKDKDRATVELWQRYTDLVYASRNTLIKCTTGKKSYFDSDIINNYYWESYEPFMKAVKTIDIPRLAHMKGSWTFHFSFKAYLVARNKNLIHDFLERTYNETSEWSLNKNGEEMSYFDMDRTNNQLDSLKEIRNINKKSESLLNTNFSAVYKIALNNMKDRLGQVTYETLSTESPENKYFKKEESRIMNTAISKAMKGFSPTQRTIWNCRLNGDGKQKISDTLGISVKDINSNLSYMKRVIQHEVKVQSCRLGSSVIYK